MRMLLLALVFPSAAFAGAYKSCTASADGVWHCQNAVDPTIHPPADLPAAAPTPTRCVATAEYGTDPSLSTSPDAPLCVAYVPAVPMVYPVWLGGPGTVPPVRVGTVAPPPIVHTGAQPLPIAGTQISHISASSR